MVDIQTSRRMLYVSFEFESKFGGSFLFFFFLKRDAQRGDEWLPPRATAFLLFTERLQKNVLASPPPLPIDGFCFLISRIVKYEWTRSFPSFFFLSPCCCHCERFPVFLFLNPSFSPNSSPLFITERIRRNKFFIGVNRGIFFFSLSNTKHESLQAAWMRAYVDASSSRMIRMKR